MYIFIYIYIFIFIHMCNIYVYIYIHKFIHMIMCVCVFVFENHQPDLQKSRTPRTPWRWLDFSESHKKKSWDQGHMANLNHGEWNHDKIPFLYNSNGTWLTPTYPNRVCASLDPGPCHWVPPQTSHYSGRCTALGDAPGTWRRTI